MSRLSWLRPPSRPLLLIASGIIITVLFALLWAIVVTILGEGAASLSLWWALLFGALLGFAIAAVRRDNRTRPSVTLVAGLFVAALWLAVTRLQPLGAGTLSVAKQLTFVVVPLMAAFTLRSILDNVPLHNLGSSEISRLTLRIAGVLGIALFIAMVLFPFYFMLSSSMKPRALLLQDPTNLSINFRVGLSKLFEGYIEVIGRFRFGRYILNSTLVASLTVIITLVPAILGAYAVTRLHFRGRRLLSNSILLIYMFPAIVLVIPLYSAFTLIGLRDSLFGLLVVYPAMTIPVALYMLRSYFNTLPRDIEESGLIDGCTRLGVIWRITLPLSLPALASVGLYVFMIAWNEFLFAFMFLDDPNIFTLSRGVVSLNSQEVPRQYLMAGAVIITVPVMMLFFWFERYLVGGLAAGGVKG